MGHYRYFRIGENKESNNNLKEHAHHYDCMRKAQHFGFPGFGLEL